MSREQRRELEWTLLRGRHRTMHKKPEEPDYLVEITEALERAAGKTVRVPLAVAFSKYRFELNPKLWIINLDTYTTGQSCLEELAYAPDGLDLRVCRELDMTSSTASTTTPTRNRFERQLEEVKVSKHDLNSVIMDYLVSEGYPEAAAKFAAEANLSPRVDVDSINQRVEIRNLIHEGDIKTAIEKINDLNPQLLDQDTSLHFYLLRLQLIELIRGCMYEPGEASIVPPVNFAMEHLSARAAEDDQLREDLEQTMCLAVFRPDQLVAPLTALLDHQMRRDMAKRVNEAMLESTGERTKAKLFDLVKLRAWSEEKARESKKELPDHLDIGLDSTNRIHGGHMHGNGNSDTMVS